MSSEEKRAFPSWVTEMRWKKGEKIKAREGLKPLCLALKMEEGSSEPRNVGHS